MGSRSKSVGRVALGGLAAAVGDSDFEFFLLATRNTIVCHERCV